MRRWILSGLFLTLVVSSPSPAVPAPRRNNGVWQQLADARAVEEIYWKHRLWPVSNPAAKPTLRDILPDATLRDRVDDARRKSAALRLLWNRPIGPAELQAELDRMAAGTKDPAMLQEIFSALGNDPRRVVEALARPALADRLARDWYTMDARFHSDARREAEDGAARLATIDDLKRASGEYREIEYAVRRGAGPADAADPAAAGKGAEVMLDAAEWDRLLAGIETEVGPGARHGSIGPLQENAEGFFVSAVVARGDNRIRVAKVVWRKRSFDDWWKETRRGLPADPPLASDSFTLPTPAAACADNTWRAMRTESPYGRLGHTAIWTGSEMIVWGGLSTDGLLKTGYRYQPATDTFTPIRSDSTAPTGRYQHAAVWTGSQMVVWGGTTSTASATGVNLNTGGLYDPSTDTWLPTRADSTAPTARVAFAALWTGTEMLIWGGVTTNGVPFNTGGRYNPKTDTWLPTGTGVGVPQARGYLTAVWTGNEAILFGGSAPQGALQHSTLGTGARYNPTTDSWTPIASGVAHTEHTAVWTGAEMIIWGGARYEFVQPFSERRVLLSSGGRYNPASDSWTATPDDATTPTARGGHTAVWTGSRMIVWGGSFNTGAQYDPATNSWTATRADATAPSARISSTAVWTGTEMIVWGGQLQAPITTSATGGRYDPVSNTWVPTHYEGILPAGVPEPPAVWTGAEMIFGGPPAGRYDPATDQWTAIAANAASAGLRVWTGTEAIAWSGAAGGRYNPATNSWSAISLAGAPATPRAYDTTIWTGQEMIVWGGQNINGATYNTGGRYNPATNAWTPTRADASTPVGRSFHSAVWTGTEMIVWGGYDSNVPTIFNTGGRYNPATDSWTATSSVAGIPDTRYWHEAVWTGTEMIAWGGNSGFSSNDPTSSVGWAYSPAGDSWRALAVDAATPSPRYRHAMVWTGREMIVWGGTGRVILPSSGGRYDPVADAWSPTLIDATTPGPRVDPASAWTGREMLIWGSEAPPAGGLGPVNTGAGYCACAASSSWFHDADGDGHGDAGASVLACSQPAGYVADSTDCNDADGGAWSTPGEVQAVLFSDPTSMVWGPPSPPGGSALTYDVLRSGNPSDFVTTATCVASDTAGSGTSEHDAPALGHVFYYLVRAQDDCPVGQGDLGRRSDGTPRSGRACP